jgi:predicted permease
LILGVCFAQFERRRKAMSDSRKQWEEGLSEELRDHIERQTAANIAAGMTRDEARRQAALQFGAMESVKEDCRDERRGHWFEALWADVRYGLRMLRKNPGFTAVAILTLALGIGGNTAVFSVMNTVLLRNLPLPHPEQLVYLRLPNDQPAGASSTGDSDTSFSDPVFEQLRNERRAFSDLVAYVPLSEDKVAVRIGQEPEEAEADMVSGNFFSGLGVAFARGRGFTVDDEKNHAPLAVLSYSYWTGRFSRSPSILGQIIYIKGLPFSVIGVTAAGFYGIEPGASTDFWIPLQGRPELTAWGIPASINTLYGTPKWWCLKLMGRLAPGVSQQQALATVKPTFARAAYIGLGTPDPKDRAPVLVFGDARGIQGMRDDYAQPIAILMAMVGLVLAIACGNVAMLLVARNSTRQREFSLRMALGAGRVRLLRQLLTESLLLVVAGGALGWIFAISASSALAAWSGIEVPFSLDANVLLFTLAISVVCALVFGLAPLRSAVGVPVGVAMKTSSATAFRSKSGARAGKVVVAGQIALCLVLLVGTGLLVRSLRNYETLPLGLRTDGLLVFGTSPVAAHTEDEKARFYQTLLERLRVVPGVESATLLENRLGSGWSDNNVFAIDGAMPAGKFPDIGVRSNDVGPDYFHVLGIPILVGRDIADSDIATAPKVVVVNETFARRFLPNANPLGHQVGGKNPYTIVGVAGDSKYTGVGEKAVPMAFFPYAQASSISDLQVELHTFGNPEALIPSVRAVVLGLDPNLPMQKPMTQRAQFEASFAQPRLFARLSMFFGLLAAMLVATGLYGTLAYRVGRRTNEIGVRMALGAQRQQVLWMILRESLLVSLIGIIFGVPLAIGGALLMRSMLFGLGPGDKLSFAGALFAITLVALAASVIPARRAASVDPLVALRYE